MGTGWRVLSTCIAVCIGSAAVLLFTRRGPLADGFLVGLCVGWVCAGVAAAVMLEQRSGVTSVAGWVEQTALRAIAWAGLLPVIYAALMALGGGWNN